jgi:hypothetical protein
VLATVRALARCPDVLPEPDDGVIVGNRPPALPPGLSDEGDPPFTMGRLPTGIGDELGVGVLPVSVPPVPPVVPRPEVADLTAIATAACGSVGR